MKHRICLTDILLLVLALGAVLLLRRVDFGSKPTAASMVADMQRYSELNLDYEQVETFQGYLLVAVTTDTGGDVMTIPPGATVMDADSDTELGTLYRIEEERVILFCPLDYTQFSVSFSGGKTAYLDMPIRCRTEDGGVEFSGTVTWIGYEK